MSVNPILKKIRRRRVIQRMGWLSISFLLAKGCASSDANSAADSPQATSDANSISQSASSDTCVLYPEQTEGPYYIDLDLVRQDITEGKDGVPLKLLLKVTDAADCTPISGAAVDIWHCDAEGNYAGYSAVTTSAPDGGYDEAATAPPPTPLDDGRGDRPEPSPDAGGRPSPRGGGGRQTPTNGETFLRGTQVTNANGQVEFDTIYPGWYRGRTVHIHLKVHLNANSALTSQMYFPDQITNVVYESEPYNKRPNRDVTNDQDGIIGDNQAVLLNLVEEEEGYSGRLTVSVGR